MYIIMKTNLTLVRYICVSERFVCQVAALALSDGHITYQLHQITQVHYVKEIGGIADRSPRCPEILQHVDI